MKNKKNCRLPIADCRLQTGKAARLLVVVMLGLCVVAAALLPGRCEAQQVAGTYVVPRIYTLFYGQVKSNQTVYVTSTNYTLYTGTNYLNYAGFHRVGLWASMNWTNPAGILNSNVTVTLNLSPGAAGGYSNSVFGTNQIWTSNNPLVWNITCASNSVVQTNLDWPLADGIAQFAPNIYFGITNAAGGWTNNIQFQLDLVLTP